MQNDAIKCMYILHIHIKYFSTDLPTELLTNTIETESIKYLYIKCAEDVKYIQQLTLNSFPEVSIYKAVGRSVAVHQLNVLFPSQ
jgi:hypothetical protein